jgi:hypothetical protein
MRKTATGRILFTTMMLTVVVAALGASSAAAAPKGAYAVFSDCPLAKSEGCLYSKTEKGEFVVGKQAVPITNPIYLQSGFVENPTNGELELIGATDGKTLSKSPQNVPGGLLDLVNCKEISNIVERVACELVFENKTTGVSATAELAGPPAPIALNEGNLFEEKGTVFNLPIKLHLENPFLGSSCYIGSESAPIQVPLTSGATSPPPPNKSIKGSSGTIEFLEDGELIQVKNVSLVNNTFAAPSANGCGGIFSLLIDPIINTKLGLPVASGHNTAILIGKIEQAGVESIKKSE